MSVLKFSTSNGLTLADYFAPSNAVSLSGQDQDLGSAAPLILPDSAGSPAHPHLVVGGEVASRCANQPASLALRNRSEFAMTLTEDNAIAAAATTGDKSTPKNG